MAAAREWYPSSSYLVSDLLSLIPELLESAAVTAPFDLIALPGNVLFYVSPGTEQQVLATLCRLLRPGGRIVTGFAIDRDYRADLDADAAALGLTVENRFATSDLLPWTAGADWCVTVLRQD